MSFTISRSLLKLTSIELVMTSNHLILCHLLSSCLQSFPASEYFPMSWLFASRSQSFGASASASVLPMNFQSIFPFGLAGLISLLVQGTLKSLLQHQSSKASMSNFSKHSQNYCINFILSVSPVLIPMWAFLVARLVNNLPAMQETLVQFLGWEDSLEKE